MDTEPVRIDKNLMKKLRQYIVNNNEDGKIYGNLSKIIGNLVNNFLDEKLMNSSDLKKEDYIDTKILKESITLNNFPESFDQESFERCVDCGSSVFRVYKESVKEGVYEQMVCVICNHRIGGWLNDFRTEGKDHVDGRVCRRCGDNLER